MLKKLSFLLPLGALFLFTGVDSQDSIGESLVTDLVHPRAVAYFNETLYVTTAGIGGDLEVQGNLGLAYAGGTSTVSVLDADGNLNLLLTSLPSVIEQNEPSGVHSIAFRNNIMWLTLAESTLSNPFSATIIGVDATTLRIQELIDVYEAEMRFNPDGGEIDSNPIDIAFDSQDRMYIADASCNCVWRWAPNADAEEALQVFYTWMDNPVPSSIYIDINDHIYVSFFSAFPFTEGSAGYVKLDTLGTVLESYSGLTAVVDMVVHEGTIYASEFGRFSDSGWLPSSGRIVMVTQDGVTPIAENIHFPYGLALNPDAGLTAVIGSAFSETGSVITLSP